MTDDWITTSEAVQISGYNPDHLRDLLRREDVKARKFGIVWQVSRSSLLSYLKEAEESPDRRRGPKSGTSEH